MCCVLTRISNLVWFGFVGFWGVFLVWVFLFILFSFAFFSQKLGLVKYTQNIKAQNPVFLNPEENCSIFLAILKQFSELSNIYDYAI